MQTEIKKNEPSQFPTTDKNIDKDSYHEVFARYAGVRKKSQST